MPTLLHRSRPLALSALVLAAACTDRGPTEVAPPPGQPVESQITCTASIPDRQVRCGDPVRTSGPADIILGGQGTYLRLDAGDVSYDAGVFSLDVAVQNLLPQPMGTPDGVTVTGVRVFFAQGPVATVGTGEVTVANADGTGQFTRASQPYFDYAEMLQPRGASRPRTWRFNAPATVERFSFTVYVQTQLPAEQGVLRWRTEAGAAYGPLGLTSTLGLYGVWAANPNDVFAVGAYNVFHWDGNEWTSQWYNRWNDEHMRDIAGSSRSRLFAAGGTGLVLRYDGNEWSPVPGTADAFIGWYEGVWARGDTVIAVGWGADAQGGPNHGRLLRSTNGGQTVSRTTFPGPTGTRQLWDVSGTSTADLWAVGFDEVPTATGRVQGVIMHSTDGGQTWSERVDGDDQHRYYGGVWAGPGRVVVGGGHRHPTTNRWEALIMESTDGGQTWTETWFAVPGESRYIREVWGSPDGTLHAVGDWGGTFINTGSGWTEVSPLAINFLFGLHGAGGEAYAVGANGTVQHYRDGAWEPMDLRVTTRATLRSVWGAGANDVYAVGHAPGPNGAPQSLLMHNDGTGWSALGAPSDSTEYVDVWGTSGSDVYVVGRRLRAGGTTGMIWHFDGATWSVTADDFIRGLTAVWGSGPNDVWAVGEIAGGSALSMMHSTDRGASWSESYIPGYGPMQVLDMWGSGPANIYAAGYTGQVGFEPGSMMLRYDGATWAYVQTTTETRAALTGVWGSGPDTVFVSGIQEDWAGEDHGIIRRSVDRGATWTELRITGDRFQPRGLNAIWGLSPNDVYAVGSGPVMHFNGTAWYEQGSQAWPVLRGVWGSSATDVIAVGERGVILRGSR